MLKSRLSSPHIYVADTGTPKGRGIFAARPFEVGELVEACPVVVLKQRWKDLSEDLKGLVFYWGPVDKAQHIYALALGYGSLYNHNNPANMRRELHQVDDTLRFIAARGIAADEELTTNYESSSGSIESVDTAWFDRIGIKPVVG
jgi:hypothetical protein